MSAQITLYIIVLRCVEYILSEEGRRIRFEVLVTVTALFHDGGCEMYFKGVVIVEEVGGLEVYLPIDTEDGRMEVEGCCSSVPIMVELVGSPRVRAQKFLVDLRSQLKW